MLNIDDRFLVEANQDQFWLMCHIAKFMNEDATCFPSNQKLCERTKWKITKLNEVKKSCIEANFLKSETRYTRNQQSSNVYTILTNRLSVMVNLRGKKAEQTPTALATPYRAGDTPPVALAASYPVALAAPEVLTNEVLTNERENAPAQISETLEEKTDVANNIGGPGWGDFPKAKTPGELANELRRFYAARPEEFRMTKEATPAMNWPAEKVSEVVNDFCRWAIGEGWERRTFKQINARLGKWFKDEQQFTKTPVTASGYAAPANLKSA